VDFKEQYEFVYTNSDGDEIHYKFSTGDEGLTYSELVDKFRYFSLALGYHEDTISKSLNVED